MTASDLLTYALWTTFWVSLLIILVLALRQPVTQRFGSRAAMLLWCLPAARLLAPVLPQRVVVPPDVPADTTQVWTAPGTPGAEFMLRDASYVLPEPVAADPGFVWPTITADQVAAIALGLWVLGTLMTMGLCLMRSVRWRRTLLAEARPVPKDVDWLAKDMAARVGTDKSYRLVLSGAASTPQLMGLRQPILALPLDFQDRYSRDEQEMALLHELTHLHRGDLAVLMASEFALALQWFNPLTAKARQALRADQEAACDEAVRDLGVSTKGYAALLLKAAGATTAVPALTLDHALKERIIRMQLPLGDPLKRKGFALLAATSAIALAAMTASRAEYTVYEEHPHPQKEDADVEEAEAEDDEKMVTKERQIVIDLQGEDKAELAKLLEKELAKVRTDRESAREELGMIIAEAKKGLAENDGARIKMIIRDGEILQSDVIGSEFFAQGATDGQTRIHVMSKDGARFEFKGQQGGDGVSTWIEKRGQHIDPDVDVDVNVEKVLKGLRLEKLGEETKIIVADALEGLRSTDDKRVEVIIQGDETIDLQSEEVIIQEFSSDDGEETKVIALAFADEDGVQVLSDGEEEGLRVRAERFIRNNPIVIRREGDRGLRFNKDSFRYQSMVLLSDPFKKVGGPNFEPPEPPAPPAMKAPEPKKRVDEEGTWILLPSEPDMSEFEEAMENFEERMEAFGERMEAWGEKMEEVGEAIEDLADACEDHIDASDEPTLLKQKVAATGETLKAVCASGGEERMASAEVRRFVSGLRISDEEKAYFRKSVREN